MRSFEISILLVLALCVFSYSAGSNVAGSVTFANNKHAYTLHVPPNYVSGTAAPLIVSLHGYGWTVAPYMGVDNLSATSDTAGFLVVYPQGVGNSWNSGPFCCGGNSLDDVGFARVLIDSIAAHYSVNRNKVYAIGCSNGAMMANRLGAQAADVFAAVCGVAGALALSTTNNELAPSRPVSVINFHALNDGTVPYAGGFGGGAPGQVAAMTKWAAANGCDIGPVNTTYNTKTTVKTWTKTGSPIEVALYTTTDGGHWWPPSYVPANSIIWNFFNRHSLAPSTNTVLPTPTSRPTLGNVPIVRTEYFNVSGQRLGGRSRPAGLLVIVRKVDADGITQIIKMMVR